MAEYAPHIKLQDISYYHPGNPEWGLHIDRMKVEAGEQVAIIGSSGAGKSTLLNLLDGRLFGWSGRVEVLGRNLSPNNRQPRKWRADVGFVFQGFSLIERATVFENVRLGRLGRVQNHHLSLIGKFGDQDEIAVETAIRDVGLEEFATQRVDRLSGGQRQRVGVARCLAQDPKILIADEPVSNLDPASATTILKLLNTCASARGATLIISSHQPKLIGDYVGRMVGLKNGRLAFDRNKSDVKPKDLAELYGWQIASAAA